MKSEKKEIQEYLEWRQLCKTRGYFWKVTRTDIINHLITRYQYVNYLEIGVHDGTNIRKIMCDHKDGVDPGVETINPPEVNYPVSSNDFFKLIDGHDIKYDLIFIDGLHHDDQVYLDIKNALNHITDDGTIICHDMNPRWEITQRKLKPKEIGSWNGDCWKAWVRLRNELADYTMEVVDTDHGVGIIRRGQQTLIPSVTDDYWEFDRNRVELLNLISIEDFYTKYD